MAAGFDIRGVMLDPARLMDRKGEYFSLLPHLKDWGYNLLHLHLTDDPGSRLVFPRRPELAPAEEEGSAFTPEEMRELVSQARELGIEVMPEIESLGHTRFITDNPRYRELAEPVPKGGFNAVCPHHPQTRRILEDILADTAEIFDHPVIHVGLDEVRFGDCPRCREASGLRRAEGASAPQAGGASSEALFAYHARWVHDVVRSLGRRPAMWGDHILKSEEIARAVERDVLVYDWHYDPRVDPSSMESLTSAGFEVIEAPASVCWRSRLGPTGENVANLRHSAAESLAFRSSAEAAGEKGLSGVVNTVWVPWRFLSGMVDPAIAFAGHLLVSGEESSSFAQEFAESFYGLRKGGPAGEAVFALYEALLPRGDFDAILWSDRAEGEAGREYRRMAKGCAERLRPALEALKDARKEAKRNAERLEDIVVTAEVALAVTRYATGERPAAASSLRGRVERAWTRSRPEATLVHHGHGLGLDGGGRANDCLLCILDRLGGGAAL